MPEFLIEVGKSPVFVITAFNSGPVPDQGVEHHRCVHQGIIGCLPTSHVGECLVLGRWDCPFPNPYTCAGPTVRAMTVDGDVAIGTGYCDALFLLIPLEFQSLHTEKIF